MKDKLSCGCQKMQLTTKEIAHFNKKYVSLNNQITPFSKCQKNQMRASPPTRQPHCKFSHHEHKDECQRTHVKQATIVKQEQEWVPKKFVTIRKLQTSSRSLRSMMVSNGCQSNALLTPNLKRRLSRQRRRYHYMNYLHCSS